MADDGANDGRINKGIAHHEFPSEIFTSTTPLARKAQQLLADVEFNIESTGNRIVLFANSDTTAKIISSPAMKQACDYGDSALNSRLTLRQPASVDMTAEHAFSCLAS